MSKTVRGPREIPEGVFRYPQKPHTKTTISGTKRDENSPRQTSAPKIDTHTTHAAPRQTTAPKIANHTAQTAAKAPEYQSQKVLHKSWLGGNPSAIACGPESDKDAAICYNPLCFALPLAARSHPKQSKTCKRHGATSDITIYMRIHMSCIARFDIA